MTDTAAAQEFFESGMMAFANNQFDKSIEMFTRAIKKDADNAIASVSRGAAYLRLNLLDQAKKDFDRAIQINPKYARAYHMRGLVAERQGGNNRALADFDRAIELNPEYGAAYYSRATLHAKMDNSDKAQEDIAMVVHLGNRNIESFMNENNVWQTQHMRVEDAIETEMQR